MTVMAVSSHGRRGASAWSPAGVVSVEATPDRLELCLSGWHAKAYSCLTWPAVEGGASEDAELRSGEQAADGVDRGSGRGDGVGGFLGGDGVVAGGVGIFALVTASP
jgi:hypothetical protein